MALIGGSILLSPNIFPWYVLWLTPFLAVTPSVPWIAFTGSVGLAYTFFLHEPWAVPSWARVLEFAPLVAGALFALYRWGRAGAMSGPPQIKMDSPLAARVAGHGAGAMSGPPPTMLTR